MLYNVILYFGYVFLLFIIFMIYVFYFVEKFVIKYKIVVVIDFGISYFGYVFLL